MTNENYSFFIKKLLNIKIKSEMYLQKVLKVEAPAVLILVFIYDPFKNTRLCFQLTKERLDSFLKNINL